MKIIENINVVDAKAWTIKYLTEVSEENKLDLLFIKGIIDNKLISRPIHIPIQEYDEIEIRVPIINVEINNNL